MLPTLLTTAGYMWCIAHYSYAPLSLGGWYLCQEDCICTTQDPSQRRCLFYPIDAMVCMNETLAMGYESERSVWEEFNLDVNKLAHVMHDKTVTSTRRRKSAGSSTAVVYSNGTALEMSCTDECCRNKHSDNKDEAEEEMCPTPEPCRCPVSEIEDSHTSLTIEAPRFTCPACPACPPCPNLAIPSWVLRRPLEVDCTNAVKEEQNKRIEYEMRYDNALKLWSEERKGWNIPQLGKNMTATEYASEAGIKLKNRDLELESCKRILNETLSSRKNDVLAFLDTPLLWVIVLAEHVVVFLCLFCACLVSSCCSKRCSKRERNSCCKGNQLHQPPIVQYYQQPRDGYELKGRKSSGVHHYSTLPNPKPRSTGPKDLPSKPPPPPPAAAAVPAATAAAAAPAATAAATAAEVKTDKKEN